MPLLWIDISLVATDWKFLLVDPLGIVSTMLYGKSEILNYLGEVSVGKPLSSLFSRSETAHKIF